MRRILLIVLIISIHLNTSILTIDYMPAFDGDSAFAYLVQQCEIGPRPPGSINIERTRHLIINALTSKGWTVSIQNFTYMDISCANIIAKWPGSNNTSLIIGSHYDTRPHADQDPNIENRTLPIIGANDGGSSTAVLLELARSLPENSRIGVQLVFFDAEDSGYINSWNWIVGSTYYVKQLNSSTIEEIDAMILVDMVGDKNLVLKRESSSTRALQDTVWTIAKELGHYDVFTDQYGGAILDDHRPFLDAGIPALDIIQHSPFPWYWHTMEDTLDKCSPESLETVGQVLETFIVRHVGDGSEYPLDFPIMPLIGTIALAAVSVVILTIAMRKLRH